MRDPQTTAETLDAVSTQLHAEGFADAAIKLARERLTGQVLEDDVATCVVQLLGMATVQAAMQALRGRTLADAMWCCEALMDAIASDLGKATSAAHKEGKLI